MHDDDYCGGKILLSIFSQRSIKGGEGVVACLGLALHLKLGANYFFDQLLLENFRP